eukprot:s818_g29.t1
MEMDLGLSQDLMRAIRSLYDTRRLQDARSDQRRGQLLRPVRALRSTAGFAYFHEGEDWNAKIRSFDGIASMPLTSHKSQSRPSSAPRAGAPPGIPRLLMSPSVEAGGMKMGENEQKSIGYFCKTLNTSHQQRFSSRRGMAPKAADVGLEQTGADGRVRATILLVGGVVTVAVGLAISKLVKRAKFGEGHPTGKKPSAVTAVTVKGCRKEAGELLKLTLPDLVAALRQLPQSLDDVPELTELLLSTQDCCKDPIWLQHRDEPATDLAEWLCDQGDEALKASSLVELSSRRQVLMEKLEELHDLKWDVPFDAEEEAIKENKIARDAAGME